MSEHDLRLIKTCVYRGEPQTFRRGNEHITVKNKDELALKRRPSDGVGLVYQNDEEIASKGDFMNAESFFKKLCEGENPYKKAWFE